MSSESENYTDDELAVANVLGHNFKQVHIVDGEFEGSLPEALVSSEEVFATYENPEVFLLSPGAVPIRPE